MRFTVKEREFFRKRVQNFLGKNANLKKCEIVNHFVKEGIARRTMYDVLKKLETEEPIRDKKRTGRPSSWTPARTRKLKRLANNRRGVSQTKLARKFDVSQQAIGKKLTKMGIYYRKREKTPKYSEEKQLRAKKLSSKLYRQLVGSNSCIIIDDEKYFCFGGDNMPGNLGYYTDDKDSCPDSVRFKGQDKFPRKTLVWVAISERGISKPLVRKSKACAIDRTIYIEECLQKRLLPFIHEHHPDFNYVFWPDLARAHYANDTQAWMEENINFVAKSSNPPNVPQARPIEDFWGCLAQKMYEGGWEAKTEDQLIRRIKAKLNEFDEDFFRSLMAGVRGKLRAIEEGGVFSYLKK